MTANQLTPAAQYLRMSTEHQQYSLENQSLAILEYADAHSLEVVRTYSDSARSGLVLRQRTGLQQLLQDVVSGAASYRAILVYDVSRWGRFQDTDESAHYEFLCKSAGAPVHYCAETFADDGTLPSLIMKALKRTMAGEYSRDLGVRVYAGMKRLTSVGVRPAQERAAKGREQDRSHRCTQASRPVVPEPAQPGLSRRNRNSPAQGSRAQLSGTDPRYHPGDEPLKSPL
jgi:DNA invertase Pin-like site-specific DNA recombinase